MLHVRSHSEPPFTYATLTKGPSILSLPFPDNRLASSALRALSVDAELSPLVRRSFTLVAAEASGPGSQSQERGKTILQATFRAATNRMLRVSVNGFMESLGMVISVMEELDVDVLLEKKRAAGDGSA
jgi:EKC/KEOPS complex subunit PCC1/LAGE3